MAASNGAPARRTPALIKGALSLMVSLYRWTGGAIGGRMGPNPVLLLTTTGRKSGQAHTVPVSYFEATGEVFIVASNGGKPQHPDWYLNLLAHPEVTIQRGRNVQRATAITADPEQHARLWAHVIATAPSYENYQKRATRQIPIVLLHMGS